MSEIVITARAYCKIILHAAKYPYCAVNGVLLAKVDKSSLKVHYVDAVPLFHIALNLTPMAEIALNVIDPIAARNGLVIAGYYTAHENLHESSIEKANHRISDKIAEQFGGACLVVVDNENLSPSLDNLAVKVAQYSDGKYRSVDKQRISLEPANTLDICSSLLARHCYKSLSDFDNHLDNICLNWMNEEVNEEIENSL